MRRKTILIAAAVLVLGTLIALPKILPGRLEVRAIGMSEDPNHPGLGVEIQHRGWGAVYVTGYGAADPIPVFEDTGAASGYRSVPLFCGTGLVDVKYARGEKIKARLSPHWLEADRRAGIAYSRISERGIFALLSRLGVWKMDRTVEVAWVEGYEPPKKHALAVLRGETPGLPEQP